MGNAALARMLNDTKMIHNNRRRGASMPVIMAVAALAGVICGKPESSVVKLHPGPVQRSTAKPVSDPVLSTQSSLTWVVLAAAAVKPLGAVLLVTAWAMGL